MKIKLVTKIFILFQILDIVITFLGIRFGLAIELNPLGFNTKTIILKLLSTLIISLLLERMEFPKIVWILPSVGIFAFFWNISIIIWQLLLMNNII